MNEYQKISLQRLTTRNYKNISGGEQGIKLQDLNIFIGSNGSGKSNLIREKIGDKPEWR